MRDSWYRRRQRHQLRFGHSVGIDLRERRPAATATHQGTRVSGSACQPGIPPILAESSEADHSDLLVVPSLGTSAHHCLRALGMSRSGRTHPFCDGSRSGCSEPVDRSRLEYRGWQTVANLMSVTVVSLFSGTTRDGSEMWLAGLPFFRFGRRRCASQESVKVNEQKARQGARNPP